MNNNVSPILVTGSHRSGSTWVGRMLALAENTAYIHEPFNPNVRMPIISKPFKYWFTCMNESLESDYLPIFHDIMSYSYPLSCNMPKVRTTRDVGQLIRDQILFLKYRMSKDRPIIKDPIALLSSEWLAKTFDMQVLVMLRHPAAFCSSLKLARWKFDFNQFLNQPTLMDGYLHPFREDIHEFSHADKSVVEQAILLWNCFHHVINLYKQQHHSWIFVRHEDISRYPIQEFESIYNALNLKFSPSVREKIMKASGEHNSIEQKIENQFVRNSKANINNWKKRLSQHEIELIRVKTENISSLFYGEDEW